MNAIKVDLAAFHAAFFDEADEHLSTIETTLLELESAPRDRELLAKVFRAAHSIKGASGTFGFSEIMRFTHGLEALLDGLRAGLIEPTPATSQLLLRGLDVLRGLVAAAHGDAPPPAGVEALQEELLRAASAQDVSGHERVALAAVPTSSTRTVAVTFVPDRDLFKTGMDPLLVVRDLCELGEVRSVELDATQLPDLDVLEPEASYLGWRIVIETEKDDSAIRDVFAFVEDSSRVELKVENEQQAAAAATTKSTSDGTSDDKPTAAGAQSGIVRAANATVRVATEKLDRLIDLVGELVISQSMVASAVDDPSPEAAIRLREAIASMDRNTRELQDRVMAVRMVPMGAVFNRFPRVVRDIASSTGKKIRLEISGEDTELDKGMVELLADPLTHLVRNAADHGVEPPEDRVSAGKPEEGLVCLRALHEGGNVVVEVSDDGRGMQTEKIRQKAITLGLLSPSDHPTEDEINALIFAAGFSTAAKVTDVSGRGVGMDVVKRNVEGMGGSITFRTQAGRGSTMRIRLPLTMAIMEGLSVRVGEQVFVAPLLSIVESFRPTREQVSSVLGRGEVVRVRGEPIRLLRLHEELEITPNETDPCKALVCVVEAGNSRAAILVDELLGQAQVVVKSLETNFRKIDGITGATILGDGRVALILDVHAIVQRASHGATKGSGG